MSQTGDHMEDGAPKERARVEAETYVWKGLYTNIQKGKQQKGVTLFDLLPRAAWWGHGTELLDLLRIQMKS